MHRKVLWMAVVVAVMSLTSCEDGPTDVSYQASDANARAVDLTGSWSLRDYGPGFIGYTAMILDLTHDTETDVVTGTLTPRTSPADWSPSLTTPYAVVGRITASHLSLRPDPEVSGLADIAPWTRLELWIGDQKDMAGFGVSRDAGDSVALDGFRTTELPVDTDIDALLGTYEGTVGLDYPGFYSGTWSESIYKNGDTVRVEITAYTGSDPDIVAMLTWSRSGSYAQSIPIRGIGPYGSLSTDTGYPDFEPDTTDESGDIDFFADFAFLVDRQPYVFLYRYGASKTYWVDNVQVFPVGGG